MKQKRQEEAIHFYVDQMSGVGQSKVWHAGGWTVRKVLNCSRKYIRRKCVDKVQFHSGQHRKSADSLSVT